MLAELLEGLDILRVIGPADVHVSRPAPISEAGSDAFTFCSRRGDAALEMIRASHAGVVFCGETEGLDGIEGKTLVVVADPRLTFLRVVGRRFPATPEPGIHPTAFVDPGATVHPGATIGPFVSIAAGCSVGEGSVLHGHVQVYGNTRIGRNVTIHGGTIIGADGFGYQRNERGELEKFPHLGGVVIEDGVEIGSNTSIDRGTLGDTILREGARIDNLVHIAHNVVVGKHAAVIANAMIGGSTVIGDGAWIAPSACLRDGIRIGDGATVGLGAVVVKDVPAGATVMGAPARDAAQYKETLAAIQRLTGKNE